MSKKTWIIIGASAGAVIAAVLILWLSLSGRVDRSEKGAPYRYTVRKRGDGYNVTVKGNRDAEYGFGASVGDQLSISVKERSLSKRKASYRVEAGEEAGSDRLTVTLAKKDSIVPDIRYTFTCDFLTTKDGELSYLGGNYSVPGKDVEIYEEDAAFSYGFSYNGYGDMIAALGHAQGESWSAVTDEGSSVQINRTALDDRDLFILYAFASDAEEEVNFINHTSGLILNCVVKSDAAGRPEVMSHEVKAAVQEEVLDAELHKLFRMDELIPKGEKERNRLAVIYSLHGEEGLMEALGITELPEEEETEAPRTVLYIDGEGHFYMIVDESIRDYMNESSEGGIIYISDESELPEGAYRFGEAPENISEETAQASEQEPASEEESASEAAQTESETAVETEESTE